MHVAAKMTVPIAVNLAVNLAVHLADCHRPTPSSPSFDFAIYAFKIVYLLLPET